MALGQIKNPQTTNVRSLPCDSSAHDRRTETSYVRSLLHTSSRQEYALKYTALRMLRYINTHTQKERPLEDIPALK
jgi:hypothetical protein